MLLGAAVLIYPLFTLGFHTLISTIRGMEVDRSSLGVPLSAAFGDAPVPGLWEAAGGSAPLHREIHVARCPSCSNVTVLPSEE